MIRQLLIALTFLLFSIYSFGQIVNDSCEVATVIPNVENNCYTSIGGETLSLNGATPNGVFGNCVMQAQDANNAWFILTAIGCDMEITVAGAGGSAATFELTLLEVEDQADPCRGFAQLACAPSIITTAQLNVGDTYFLLVTSTGNEAEDFELCFTNAVPPVNDNPCNATAISNNCTPVAATNIGSCSDWRDPSCLTNSNNTVWFTAMVDPGNNALEIDVTNLSSGADISLAVVTFPDGCNGTPLISNGGSYCGPAGNDLLLVAGLTPGTTYYIFVSTTGAQEGTFNICADQIGPPPGCSDNNVCGDATSITGIVTGSAPTCVNGCNILAAPEPALDGCNMATEEVVWFSFAADASADIVNLNLTSDDISSPTVQVFTGNCGNLTALTNCVTGASGSVSLLSVAISPNTTYYLAVSNDFGDGGNFELCIGTFINASACATDTDFEVTGTSLGSPLEGPYQPGETVSFCFRVDVFQVDNAGTGNNCQWFQGIVPVFGNCWDPSSFNPNGEPISSTPPNTLYDGQWGWWNNITYNRASPTISVGDFDGDGDLDMCHVSDPSCPNTGVSAGQILPGGWFAHVPGQGQNPNQTFGDGGPGCNTTNGPWEVCFDVTTRLFPDCQSDPSFTDCAVSMFTFADGETGSWVGSLSICANDFPSSTTATQRCCEGPTVDPQEIELCNGDTLSVILTSNQDPDVTYTWAADADGAIVGATDGAGPAILQILENTSNSVATVVYTVSGINTLEGCAGVPGEIVVNINPGLEVTSDPIDGCEGRPFVIGVDVANGSGNYSYNWVTGDVGPNPTVTPTVTTVYAVTVTDNENGCTGVGNIEVTVNPNFEVEIVGDSIVCADQGGTGLEAMGLGGSQPYQDYSWDTPDGFDNGEVIFATSSGTYSVTVTDDNGCFGEKAIEVTINPLPELDILATPSDRFCAGSTDSVVLELITPNSNIEDVYWEIPNGNRVDDVNSIIAREEGEYILTIIDENLCENSESIFLEEEPAPNPTITGTAAVCLENGTGSISVTEFYDSYLWSTGSDTRMTDVDTPGIYSITVVDNGCVGVAVWAVDTIAVPNPDLSGSSSFCTGFSTTIDAGAGFISYNWSSGPQTQTVSIDAAGLYFVTVTDAAGCTGVDSIMITEESSLRPIIAGDTMICPGEMTILDAGEGFTSYQWNSDPTLTGRTLMVTDAGPYTVEVSDGNCTGSGTVNVSLNVLPTPTITGRANLCEGASTTLRVDGNYQSYVWSSGTTDITDSLVISTGNIYMVSVTDNQGCEGVASFVVDAVLSPDPTLSGTPNYCPGNMASIDAGAGYMSYAWSDGQMTQVANFNTEDLFYITVTDAFGCEGIDSVEIIENVAPTPQIAGSSTFCPGSSTTLDAGDYVSYIWSVPGEVSRTIDVNTAGDISVTVTDANNCTGIAMISVEESSQLEPNISGDLELCVGNATTLDAGAGFDTYLWSNGEITQTIIVNTAGDYSVDVSLGTCTGSGMVAVTASIAPRAELQNTFEICNTEAAGSILNFDNLILSGDDTGVWENVEMIPTSGSFPFINFDGVDVGVYDFTYTTNSAVVPCLDTTYTIQISVTDCDCPSVALDVPPGLCNDDLIFDLNSVKITSEPGAWVVISVPNGSNPATVTGDGTLNIENADPGTYRVQFQLANPEDLCPETNSIQIELGLASFAGTPLEPAVVCIGEDNTIELTTLITNQTAGGMWIETSGNMSTGGAFDEANATFRTESQEAGTYTFAYVIDATAPCEDDMAMVEVIIENVPNADAGSSLQISCGEPEVTIGGAGTSIGTEFDYTWSDSSGTVIGSSPTVSVDVPGTYRLDVVNRITTCTNFDEVEVTLNPNTPSEIETEFIDPRCFGLNNGSITVLNVVGGTPPFVYSIDGGPFVNTLEFGTLSGGPHTITIMDDEGCMLEKQVILTEPEQSPIELGPDIFLILGDSANLNLSLSLDISEIVNITWNTPEGEITGLQTSIQVKPSTTTSYEVIVEDINGCFSTDQIRVIVSRDINVFVPTAFSPNNDNINDIVRIHTNDEIVMINKFQIFDRWGELVFQAINFSPRDESIGWDGTLNGEPLNPQVFIWTAEVEFRDPLLDPEIISGDITLIR